MENTNTNNNNLSIENIQLKFQQQQQNILEPIQKDKGINFIFLNQSNDNKIKDDGIIITIGNLGSFIYNKEKPLLIPPDKTLLQPPPPPTPMKCKDADFVRKLTREECQEALIKYADKKCCIRKRPAEHMHVKTANTYNSFSYILTTFTEKRSLILKYSSIKPGEQLDLATNNMNSIISDPLLIDSEPNEMFKTHTKYEYVPKSDTLYPCYRCNGFGCLRCSQCNGIGNITCNKCNGLLDQTNIDENNDENKRLTCDFCNGKTLIDCKNCSSKGEIICNKCNGNQWLKWYLQVKFDYINHTDEYLSEKSELPDQVIKIAQGEILKQDEGAQIIEINDCSNDDINQNSKRLIQKTKQEYNNLYERQLFQKHCLTLITCTECEATYQAKEFKFWVLGQNKKIYSPDYPGGRCCGCCCCCTII